LSSQTARLPTVPTPEDWESGIAIVGDRLIVRMITEDGPRDAVVAMVIPATAHVLKYALEEITGTRRDLLVS
jgi:hypothetical protein